MTQDAKQKVSGAAEAAKVLSLDVGKKAVNGSEHLKKLEPLVCSSCALSNVLGQYMMEPGGLSVPSLGSGPWHFMVHKFALN